MRRIACSLALACCTAHAGCTTSVPVEGGREGSFAPQQSAQETGLAANANPGTPVPGGFQSMVPGGFGVGSTDVFVPPVDLGPPPGAVDDVCERVRVSADPVKPQMLIMLDRSGSMVLQGRWNPSVQAIREVVDRLQNRIDFGLALFPDPNATVPGLFGPMTDTCGAGSVEVAVAESNAAAIGAALTSATPTNGWTPTAASLQRLLADYVNIPVGPDQVAAEKYILFVTDGQPNCGLTGVETSPDDIAASNQAIEALTAAGAKTYVIGYKGEDPAAAVDPAADPSADPTMAAADPTAAAGLPPPPPLPGIAAPPWEELAMILDGFAQRGGTGDMAHRPVEDAESLVAEFERISESLIPCVYALEEAPPDPTHVLVKLDGLQLNLSDPNGWSLVQDTNVEITGDACLTLKDGLAHSVDVEVTCEEVIAL